ncbi:octopamine receptor [Eurosta solidaginis]|uniref:octopamine receptor n=1 Tax=Eurosta solidaginis TaxID=178769 RepID=UPI003530A643
MTVRPSGINIGDVQLVNPTQIWAILNESKNANVSKRVLQKLIHNLPKQTKNPNLIFNIKTVTNKTYALYYSAKYKNNNILNKNSNNDSTTTTQTHRTSSLADMDLTNSEATNTNTIALLHIYGDAEVEVINRTLALTTNVNGSTSDISSNNIPSPTIFMANTTNVYTNITSVSDADEEWARFYDLMLSWQGICLIAVFSTLIVVTFVGNMLVILAVITTRRLKTVTNCFVMSLAVADLLVGIFVMPPAVAVHLIGSWRLGWVLCDVWISLDVLLCTASILSLCAISVDRYLAVTQPLTYSRRRRSKRLAFIMILVVWVLALAITCPPMLGWYEPGRRDLSECRYNQNEGYVIFSAMGSFFIPMAVMIYVYARISCVVASRHDHMTDISVHNKKFKRYTAADVDHDIDYDFSELELSSGQRKQAAARTFSNQTIAKELHDVMLSEGDIDGGGKLITTPMAGSTGSGNGAGGSTSPQHHSLSTLVTATVNTKNSCYELTRPSSLKRTPTSSSTITVMTSGCGVTTTTSGTSGISGSQTGNQGVGGGSAVGGLNVATTEKTFTSINDQPWPMRTHSARHHHHFGTSVHGSSSNNTGLNTNATSVVNVSTSPNLHIESATLTRQIRLPQQQQQQQQQSQPQQHHHHHTKSFSNRITSLKKENKTTQTLSIVVGGFIACWLPFFIYYLITPFLDEHEVSRTLAKGLTWLGWFNSAINPFIYAFYSVDFRAAFWRLTFKRFFSVPMKPQFPANTMSIRR